MHVGRFMVVMGCAAVIALAGCGTGSDTTAAGDLNDVSVPPATAPHPVTTSTASPSTPTTAARATHAKPPSLAESLRARIEHNRTATGSPRDSDQACRARKLKYGATDDVAEQYSEQAARRLHTLCPTYFLALGESRRLDHRATPSPAYTPANPEYQLAQLDENAPPSQADVRPYARLLDTLARHCTGSRSHLADLTVTTVKTAHDNHGVDVSNLHVLRAVAPHVGPRPHDCKYDFIGYLGSLG